MRNNIYVKTFNTNNSNLSPNVMMNMSGTGSHPLSGSPNMMMYPKVSTPVSLDQLNVGLGGVGSQTIEMSSPFHQMAMVPNNFGAPSAVHQTSSANQNIPQLNPIRVQPGASETHPPFPVKKKRGRPPLDGEFEQYSR